MKIAYARAFHEVISILAINETKLDSTIKDNQVHLPGYDVTCKDRENNGRHGRGVCIYIRSNINFQIRADLSPSDIECLNIEISRPRSKLFLVSTWYRPPQSLKFHIVALLFIKQLKCDSLRILTKINFYVIFV